MTTELDYDKWLAGESTITEIATDAVRLLGKEIARHPKLSRAERYAVAYALLVASVPELKAQLDALIRGES